MSEQYNLEWYKGVINRLQEALPASVVKGRQNDPTSHYIDHKVYMNYLDEITCGQWDYEILREYIDPQERFVSMFVRVKIGNHFRDGRGFGRIIDQNLENAFDRAEAEAFRLACDKFKMGWHNLDKYSGLGLESDDSGNFPSKKCVACKTDIFVDESLHMKDLYPWVKIDYHEKCLPSHLRTTRKNRPS